MGLFDFFKKKEKDIPPSFQKVFEILFPNGTNDHKRQLGELSKYYGGKYDIQEIDNNLIFILTGYLITGNTKNRESSISCILNRLNNKMNRNEIEYLHDFALKNHPKLSILLFAEAFSEHQGKDGCDTDTIPNGDGLFGFSPNNPIPTKGIMGIYDYISRLNVNGEKVSFNRIGSILNNISKDPIDEFEITSTRGIETLYFSAYHKRTSQIAPIGYILVDSNNTVLSSSDDKEPTSTKKTLPQLIGLTSFSCFSDKDFNGVCSNLREAEKYNKEAIRLYNNDDFENAFDRINKAISLHSLNAVNNKFSMLHTADRYDEAFKFLESIIDTKDVTIMALYNLAVLYYNDDLGINYNISKNVNKAYELLLKAKSLPHDEREENREQTINKVLELISLLEHEDDSLLQLKNELSSISQNIKQLHKQNSTSTTDIYGEKLMDRLSDIYSCIHTSAITFLEQMVGWPKPSNNGIFEVEIIMAAILSHRIDKNIILQSLLLGNSKFNELNITNILLSIDSYLKSYRYNILLTHLTQRVPLMEFAKTHGKLQIGRFNDTENPGVTFKAPLFVKEDSQRLFCGFVGFYEEEQTPSFISQNKNNIYVDVTNDGKYLFRLKRDIDYKKNTFIKLLAWYIYVSPLNYQHFISEEELEEGLKQITRTKTNVIAISDINHITESDFDKTSDIIPSMSYAISESSRVLEDLASSLGLIGTF